MSSPSTLLHSNNRNVTYLTSSKPKTHDHNSVNNESNIMNTIGNNRNAKASMNNISIHSNDSGLAQSLSSASSFTSPNHSSSIPSPTISLVSSSSSSPSSASSSPISNLLTSNNANTITSINNNAASLNSSLSKLVGSSDPASKKSAALSNITATIAKHQKNQLLSSLAPTKSKVLSSLDGNVSNIGAIGGSGGVACSIVKSNTNIYYNSKVDTATSKAIHYCNHCTNPNCKAIHKSLTKPLIAHSQPIQLSSTPSLSTSLLSSNNPNRSSSSSNSTRIYLSPSQQANSHSPPLSSSSSSLHSQSSQNNNQFNKLLGANVNFIFERRYPLVQLNSSLFNATNALQSPNSPTNETSSLTSALNQLATQSIANHSAPTRHPLKYAGSGSLHRLTSPSPPNDENLSVSSMSPPTTPTPQSFPLPFSPPSQHNSHGYTKQPPSLSINLNRLLATPTSNNSNNSQSSNNRRQLLSAQNQQLLQQLNEAIDQQGLSDILKKNFYSASNDSSKETNRLVSQQSNLTNEDSDDAQNSPTSMFPFNMNNLNLRYKNIMFLDQFNKDQRPQSPSSTTPRDLTEKSQSTTNGNLKITTTSSSPIVSTNNLNNNNINTPSPNKPSGNINQIKSLIQQQQLQQATPSPKNEKEIQIQRISSNQIIEQQNGTKTKSLDSSTLKITTNNSNELQSPSSSTINQSLSNVNSNNKTINTPSPSINDKSSKLNKSTNRTFQRSQQSQIQVPPFHFPNGRLEEKQFKTIDDTEVWKQINIEFKQSKDGKIFREEFGDVVKLLGLPIYWKNLLFRTCTLNSKTTYVTYQILEQVWSKLTNSCFERASLFMKLICSGPNQVIVYEDWEPLMQDIVDTHPGLKFLHDHKEFHTRYIKTVIARIYYTVNRSWSGKITLMELKRSNFLSVLESLEFEDDINLIKDYFSYEHFYVIYCKFWELDKDHDLYISKEDLYRHNNYAISPRVIDRIFSGTVMRSKDWREGLMSYYDFVWFLIAEEDKRNQTSIEYWFRVLDLDGDGILSMYELEYFYNEQIEQMRDRQIEYMPFTDLLCQILDLVKPIESGKIRLKDLKQCKMTNVFFDTFINLEKYLEYEQRDPFSNMRDLEGPEQSDWEKYAADEYENLVSEDVNGDNQEIYNNYDDDFEDEPLLFNNSTNNNANNTNQPLNSPNGNMGLKT